MRFESELDLLLLPLRGTGDIELFLEGPYLFLYVLVDNLADTFLFDLLAPFQLQLPLLQRVHSLCVSRHLLYLKPQLPYKVLDIADLLSQCVFFSDACSILALEVGVLAGDIGHDHALALDSLGELALQGHILRLQVVDLLEFTLGRGRSVLPLGLIN